MKIRKITAVLMVIILCLSLAASVSASKDEYTWPDGWDVGTYSYATVKGVEAEAATEEAHSGTYSLKVWNKLEKNTRIWVKAGGLTAGKTYTASAYIKIVGALPDKAGAVMRVSADYKDGASAALGASDRISTTDKKWKELTASFTVPEGAADVAVCLDSGIIEEGSAIYWDDVTIKNTDIDINGGFEKVNEVKPEVINIPEGSENLVINGSFEENNGTSPTKWNAYQGWGNNNPYVSLSSEQARTGKTAVKLQTTEDGKNPWVSQLVAVEPGVEYVATIWVYSNDPASSTSNFRIKFEFYSDANSASAKTALDGNFVTETLKAKDGKWVKIQKKFSTGIECHGVAIYPRLYGAGTCYYDDLEVYQLTEPKKMFLNTDWGIYYPDFEGGFATASSNPKVHEEGMAVSLVFKDGNTIVKSQEKLPITEEGVRFDYSIDLLKEKGKAYIIEATLYDGGGSIIEVQEKPIYKFDRSPYLREDGVYLKNKTTPFYPVFAYHAGGSKHMQYLAEAGINTVQVTFGTIKELDSIMAVLQENDIMGLIALYSPGVKPAAHPDLIERNREALEKYKDHPNVLGWMVQDEPFIHGEYNEVVRLLLESYAFIRSIDPEHPVYTLDNAAGTFYETSKYVDILATDPYPTSKRDPATWIAEQTVNMRKATRGEKPIYSAVQAFELGIWPTADQLRSSLYQTFFEGGTAIGYYAVSDARKAKDGTNIPLYETDLWPALTEFAKVDMDMAYKVFAGGEIPTFNDVRGDDYWYRSWGKDGKMYLVVLNRSNTETKNAEIPLTSFDGSVTVGDFTAKIIAGGSGGASGNGVLKATLQPCGAQLWEITPSQPVDFSVSAPFTYYDMDNYGWARAAAELMKEKGITYDPDNYEYRPGERITRGDFAMFLVRTLGLTGDAAVNFDDVDPGAHYAKEIAIGKAAGILNGIGNNKYNPEAEITRQDLMTIVARGMGLTGDADTSVFSDAAQISDYALLHVKAMLSAGFVKGNADGTLNPFGNTTRAEAAVIMMRILNR